MNRVEQLSIAGRSYARVWREFVKQFALESNSLYCFFEGQEDPKYYGNRIDTYVFGNEEANRRNLWCEGKDNLIELYKLVASDARYHEAWVAFFMDIDFDEPDELPSSEMVYITPCYSIENLYVGTRTIRQILHDEFCLSVTDEDFNATIDLYEKLLNKFIKASTELNAWIFLQRDAAKRQYNNRINLQNISDDKLLDIKLVEVSKKYSIDDLGRYFPDAKPLSHTEVNEQIKNFKEAECISKFRGKYFIYFLRKVLTALVEDSNKSKNRVHFQKKRKVAMQLSSNIISELSKYADTPPCLVGFLQTVSSRNPLHAVSKLI
jgi:hypothetical protein